MDQQLKELSIKIEKGSNLEACLVKYTKPRLKAILDIYGEKVSAAAKKQEMVDRAEEVIKADIIRYFAEEGKIEMEVMADLCDNGLVLNSAEDINPIKNIIDRGFAYITSADETAEVFVPENIKYILLAGMETTSAAPLEHSSELEVEAKTADMNRTEEEAEVIKYAKALANIYGVFPAKQLKEVWDFNHRRGIAPKDVIAALDKAGKEDGFYVASPYVVSNLLPSIEQYYAVLDKHEKSETFYYASEDDIEAYENGPIYTGTQEYIFLKSFIQRKMENPESIDAFMEELFLLCVRDAAPNEVIEFVETKDIKFADLEEFNKFVSLYTEWFYTVRVWACKGYKPAELRVERMQNRSFKLPSNIDPRKAKKIGRNDSCPCGSGKKFKNCCAKLI